MKHYKSKFNEAENWDLSSAKSANDVFKKFDMLIDELKKKRSKTSTTFDLEIMFEKMTGDFLRELKNYNNKHGNQTK